MNVPAVAKQTYEELKDTQAAQELMALVTEQLDKIPDALARARFVHELVDGLNAEVFSHPLVQQMSPCKMGCSACCHTQVSVTLDEALLLEHKIQEGIALDQERLEMQMRALNNSEDYYKLSFKDRKCLFLSEEGSCLVYHDRPSVCRTNVVLGTPAQCDTSVKILPTQLVKTQKADLVIYASFLRSSLNGTLPSLLGEVLLVE